MVLKAEKMVRVQKGEIGKASNVLTNAFMNDPLISYIFSNGEQRNQLLMKFFRMRVRYGIRYGEVYASSHNFEGVAMWLPGKNVHASNWRGMRAGGLRLYFQLGLTIMKKIQSVNHYTHSFREKLIDHPYWYVGPIGVVPEHQRKGVARSLLQPLLARMNRENMDCFLETQNKKNVAIYERYGFTVIGRGKIPQTEIPHWGMCRAAISADGTNENYI
jgi:ribosomal protein S18 acetylase RimI-like enzyme